MAIKIRITDAVTGDFTFAIFEGSLEEDCANLFVARFNDDYDLVEVEDSEGNYILYEDFIYEPAT